MIDAIFLAAESGGSAGNVAALILIAGLVAFAVAYFVVGPGRRKGPKSRSDIPLSMRPYHSDEELETTGIERAMSWGVALAVFAAMFLPLYWVIEPSRQQNALEEQYEADVAQGQSEFQNACASCHGTDLSGGSAPHPDPDVEAAWPAPALNNIVARYEDSEIVEDPYELIMHTVRNGRPGTPMSAFSTGQGGSLNDQQLEAIATYILSVQTGEVPEAQEFAGASGEDVFANNCARCHGQDAEGYTGPQLVNVFERYGWEEGDEASKDEARAAIRSTIEQGRFVPGVGMMPPFENELDEDAITAVLDHLESIQETGGPSYATLGGLPDAEE